MLAGSARVLDSSLIRGLAEDLESSWKAKF